MQFPVHNKNLPGPLLWRSNGLRMLFGCLLQHVLQPCHTGRPASWPGRIAALSKKFSKFSSRRCPRSGSCTMGWIHVQCHLMSSVYGTKCRKLPVDNSESSTQLRGSPCLSNNGHALKLPQPKKLLLIPFWNDWQEMQHSLHDMEIWESDFKQLQPVYS